MSTKKISLFLVVLFITSIFYAQENKTETDIITRSNELGIHAGFTTGLGLSFRHWSDKLGVQLTAIPIKSNDFQFISVGLTGLYSLSNSKYHRFFLYLGNHMLISNDLISIDGVNESEIMYNLGFGPGFEVGKKVRFNIMLGYAAYNLNNIPDYSLLPSIEMGLYFKL